uniref:Uncharacterized protein n=1 Tax=Chenopodium quinoa TaxID=63459 RepID=A0A803KQ73_CHEQI
MAIIWEETDRRLIPLLDNVSKRGVEIDVQDIFKRFTYDNVCNIVMDYDPKFLALELPPIPVSQAVIDIEEFSTLLKPNTVESDILPSGHRMEPDMQIIFDAYAKGRMKSIWGDDWPRICQREDMALTQLKFVVAAIIRRYDIEVVQGHQVVPDISVTLQMKHGCQARLHVVKVKFCLSLVLPS